MSHQEITQGLINKEQMGNCVQQQLCLAQKQSKTSSTTNKVENSQTKNRKTDIAPRLIGRSNSMPQMSSTSFPQKFKQINIEFDGKAGKNNTKILFIFVLFFIVIIAAIPAHVFFASHINKQKQKYQFSRQIDYFLDIHVRQKNVIQNQARIIPKQQIIQPFELYKQQQEQLFKEGKNSSLTSVSADNLNQSSPKTNRKYPKFSRQNKYLKKFQLNGPQITYIGQNQKWTQLLVHKPLPQTPISISFIPTYSPSLNSHIVIGVTSKDRLQQRSSFFHQGTYAYYGHNGCIWAEGKLIQKDAIGFKQKDKVQMTIWRQKGLIMWKVNAEVRGQVEGQALKAEGLVLYLEMFENGDTIRFLQ